MSQLAIAQHDTTLTPKRLILELLDAEPREMGSSARLLAAGEVFGFSGNQMRVALSRLVADTLLASPRRGQYQLSGGGAAMHREIQRWQELEQHLVPWQGDWCALVTDKLAAENSTRFRAQTRALQLRGLQRWRPGIWVRPNNLCGGLQQLCREVSDLGLDSIAASYLMQDTDAACEKSLRSMWDTPAINQDYKQRIKRLSQALEKIHTSNTTAVLLETVELGGDTIRALLKDPLLPDAMLGSQHRQQLIELLRLYDSAGRALWLNFIQQL